jgi:hypothetical protein
MKFEIAAHNIDENAALIYMWEIFNPEGVLLGKYVGKAKSGSKRPYKHYKRNVKRLLAGLPYRKSNATRYRNIHIALGQAVSNDSRIRLSFICNVPTDENINDVEKYHINKQKSYGANSWQLNR